MGCCRSREGDSNEDIEKLLLSAEMQLKFFNFSARRIFQLLDKNSSNSLMTHLQLSKFCEKLGLSLHDFSIKGFFSEYFDRLHNLYLIQSIYALAILLCSDENQIKLELLFRVYSKHSQKWIEKSEIETMVLDICNASFEYLTSYSSGFNSGKKLDSIQNYRHSLIPSKKTMIKHFAGLIFEDVKSSHISHTMFTSFAQNTKVCCLLKAKTLRLYTFEVMRIYNRAFNAIDYIMDDRHADSSEVYHDIQRSVGSERHHGKVRI